MCSAGYLAVEYGSLVERDGWLGCFVVESVINGDGITRLYPKYIYIYISNIYCTLSVHQVVERIV